MDYRSTYMEILLRVAIRIQEGDSLSINTNPSHLDFARELAQSASETTLQAVHIVVIEDGVPGDVLEVTPVIHEQSLAPPTGAALLRLDDTEDRDWDFTADPVDIVQNMGLLQKVGNLAPPQLDKQVAPWAVVPVPGPVWARRILGKKASEEDLWKALGPVFKLDTSNPLRAWQDQVTWIDHRLSLLNRHDVVSWHIRSDEGTDLSVCAVDQSRWRGGVLRLGSGRTFLPLLPLERVSMLVERLQGRGVIKASRPFRLLGGMVEGASFELAQGTIVGFDADRGKELLALALSMDSGSAKLGELSLVDEHSQLGTLAHHFGYGGFDENLTSSITIGMGETYHLEALDTYADEMELQEQTGCNVSTLRARIPIGTGNLQVSARLEDGSEIVFMQNGVFLT
ncbi:MAG: aminopeptidase [Sphaerochaetaceae bacterium]